MIQGLLEKMGGDVLTTKGFQSLSGLKLKVFSNDELNLIHEATLRVLWRTGLQVESEEAVDIYHDAGCEVVRTSSGGRVKIPPYLVNDAIASVPGSFVFYGRDPAKDFKLEPGRVGFSFFGENVNIIDLNTRQLRRCTKKDLGEATRLGDSVGPVVPFIHKCMGSLDQMPATQALHNYHAMVANSDKHIVQGFINGRNAAKIIEMGAACSGSMENFKKRPIVTNMVCPTSPLVYSKDVCDMILECAGAGVGFIGTTMPLSGVTAPTTTAGSLLIVNAELLGILVLAQIIRKGLPYMFANYGTIVDLKIGTACLGAPEAGLLAASITKMARYYGIPMWCGVGVSDSKIPDSQAAYENCINAVMAALGGANVVDCIGGFEAGLTFDYAKAVMDIENAGMIIKLLEGVEISEEALALDTIEAVGPGGDYLSSEHTLRHMRSMSSTKLFDRNSRDLWARTADNRNISELAYEKAAAIIAGHQPAQLQPALAEELETIINDYEGHLRSEKP
jgi:trimethylamine---corrinoid protein Co-methyltransferase